MRLRPRSSMKPFRGPPWGQPRMYGEAREPEPAPWIVDFKNMQDRLGLRVQGGTAALISRDASARFQRSQRNPSVGYDTKRKKFTVMVVENGVDAPKGSFRAEEEAVEAHKATLDVSIEARMASWELLAPIPSTAYQPSCKWSATHLQARRSWPPDIGRGMKVLANRTST